MKKNKSIKTTSGIDDVGISCFTLTFFLNFDIAIFLPLLLVRLLKEPSESLLIRQVSSYGPYHTIFYFQGPASLMKVPTIFLRLLRHLQHISCSKQLEQHPEFQ